MIIISLILCLSLLVIPAQATQVQSTDPVAAAVDDGTFDSFQYIDIESNLGQITLYFPRGTSPSSFVISSGALVNMSNSTIYLYCPQYPEYTFSASRFGPLSYRQSGYDTTVLTGVSIVDQSYDLAEYTDVLVIVLLLFVAFILIWKGRS